MKDIDKMSEKYLEWQQNEYFPLECPNCGNTFLTRTTLEKHNIGDLEGFKEPEEDSSFTVYCPLCQAKVTGLGSEKVNIFIISPYRKE